jgi:hypothetical protein
MIDTNGLTFMIMCPLFEPINAVGPYEDGFLPLQERSELPQLLLYFSSVFFSERQYPCHLPMKFFFS